MFESKDAFDYFCPASSTGKSTREKEIIIPLYVRNDGDSLRPTLTRTPVPVIRESACALEPCVLVVHVYDTQIEARSAMTALEGISRNSTEIARINTGESVLLSSCSLEIFASVASDDTLRAMRKLAAPNDHLMVVLLDHRKGEFLKTMSFSDSYTHRQMVQHLHSPPFIEGMGSIPRVRKITELIANDLDTDTAVKTMQAELGSMTEANVTLASISTGVVLDHIEELMDDGELDHLCENGPPCAEVIRNEIDRLFDEPWMITMTSAVHQATLCAVMQGLRDSGALGD